MRQLYHIYVVLEDTVEMRYTMRHCMRMEVCPSPLSQITVMTHHFPKSL